VQPRKGPSPRASCCRCVVPCRDVAAETGMEGAVLKNILGSMLFAKDLQVLKKTPASKIIDEAHEVEINGGYRSNAKVCVWLAKEEKVVVPWWWCHLVCCAVFAVQRVALPGVILQEKITVQEKVTAEQVHVLESIIVRVMKTRKVMVPQELHRAVMEQCVFFRPDLRQVRQRIEDLMKRGYIDREDPTVHTSNFVYVPGPVDD
jgi:hypothetical protein